MSTTLSILVSISAVVHEVQGGGYWAEVPALPGCVAPAETLGALKEPLAIAVRDWLSASPVKTEDEARQLAAIQGSRQPLPGPFPQPNAFLLPPSWTDEAKWP